MSERDDDRVRIRSLLATVHEAWTKGEADDLPRVLGPCVHDKVVFRGPDLAVTAAGAEAAIASYAAFMRAAEIERYTLGDLQIDLAGDTAIASSTWTMTYRHEGRGYEESGQEIVVLTRDEAAWLIRWRTVLVTSRKER